MANGHSRPSRSVPLPNPRAEGPRTRGSLEPRTILYGYVARELVGPAALALAVFVAVVLTRDLPAYAELVINRGAGMAQVSWILACQAVALASPMFPFSVLVGGLIGLGRLVADREIMVLAALGLDPRRLIGPVAVFGAAMACLALALGLAVSPLAQRELNRTVRALAEGNPFSTIEADVVQRFGNWKLEASKVSDQGQLLGRVRLWLPSVGETIFSNTARLATQGDGRSELELKDGVLLTNTRVKLRALRFESLRAEIPKPTPAAALPFEDRLESASFDELATLASEGGDPANPRRRREAASELQRRIAFPAAAALLAVLALPLALGRSGTSRSSGALVGLAITLVYYGLIQAAEGIAQRNPELSSLAIWLPNAVLLATIGVLFLALALPPGMVGERMAARVASGAAASQTVVRSAPRTLRLRVRRWALPRYVALRFAQLAIASLAVLVIAYLLVDVLERLQWFARHAPRFEEIVHFYSARIPLLASRVAPMGLVVAMALTVSVLTSSGELLGMRALGISTHRALLPALGLCLLAMPLSFLLNDQIVPRTNQLADLIKQRDIKQGEIKQEPAAEPRRTAVWGSHGRILYQLERLDATQGAGQDIIVYELLESGLPKSRIDARSTLHVGGGHWKLFDATAATFADPDRLTRVTPPANVELGKEPSTELDLMHLSVAQLMALIREVAASDDRTTDLEVDLHVKLATPLACFVLPALVMLIASTGPPFPGSAMTLIIASAIAVGYTLLVGAFASFGRSGVLWPWLGGWGPSLIAIALLAGIGFRDRVARRGVRG